MIWIEGIAINADIQLVAAMLDDALSPFVAFATKGLQATEDEFVAVAFMWLDVVSDHCPGDDTARETETAQW
jgi:hypothetical protein